MQSSVVEVYFVHKQIEEKYVQTNDILHGFFAWKIISAMFLSASPFANKNARWAMNHVPTSCKCLHLLCIQKQVSGAGTGNCIP